TVNNVAPTAVLVAPTAVDEAATFSVGLTSPFDPSTTDTTAGFHYAYAIDGASLAAATYANSGIAASMNFSFDDGPSVHTVTERIFDKDGGHTDYTATITVNNVAPTAVLVAPTAVDEAATFSVGLTSPFDPSATDTTAG